MRKVCAQAGCRVRTNKRHCPECQNVHKQRSKNRSKITARKSSAKDDPKYAVFYSSQAWKRLREYKIRKSPLCQECEQNGFTRCGYDVDHVIEIKDDFSRRLDVTNLRTLCRACHTYKTHQERLRRNTVNSQSTLERWSKLDVH